MARNNIHTGNPGVSKSSFQGPIKSAQGAFYVVNHLAGIAPRVWKATDPLGGSWTSQDTAGEPIEGTPGGLWIHLDGNVIHIATHNAANADIFYHAFNTSSDTWTTVDKNLSIGATLDPGLRCACIYVQTDGDIVIVGTGVREPIHGQMYNRVNFWRSTDGGANFSGFMAVDDGGQIHYGGATLHGVGNRVHVIFSSSLAVTGAATTGHHKTIRDDDTLSTVVNLAGGGADLFNNSGPGVDYDDAGTRRVRIPYRVVTTLQTEVLEFDDGDSPTITENTGASDNAVRFSGMATHGLANDGTKVFLMYIDTVALDIFSDENDDDAGWGTDVTEEVVTNATQIWCNVYDNGGLKLAWVDEESSQLWYNEKSIVSGPTLKVGSDTVGLDITESASEILASVAVSDTLGLSISEAIELLVRLGVTDTAGLAIVEGTPVILATLDRVDALDLATLESVKILSIIERVDTLNLAIIDASAVVVIRGVNDQLDLAIIEGAADLLVSLNPNDIAGIAIVEGVPVILSSLSRDDSLDLALVEVADLVSKLSVSDTSGIATIEASAVAVVLAVADSAGISITEVVEILSRLDTTDALDLSVAEISGIVALINANDTLELATLEITDLLSLVEVTDILGLTVTQTVFLQAALAVLDVAGIAISELSDLFKINAAIPIVVGDTLGLGVAQSAVLEVLVNTQETAGLSLAEVAGIFGEVTVTDKVDLSIDDTTILLSILTIADTLGLNCGETAEIFRALSVSDDLDLTVTKAAGLIITEFEGIICKRVGLDVATKRRIALQAKSLGQVGMTTTTLSRIGLAVLNQTRMQLGATTKVTIKLEIDPGVQP